MSNKKNITLVGDVQNLRPQFSKSLKIGGVEVGPAMILCPRIKTHSPILELLDISKSAGTVHGLLPMLRGSVYGEMAVGDLTGFSTFIAFLKATQEAIGREFGKRPTRKVVQKRRKREITHFILDWKRLQKNSADGVKMSFKEWLEIVGCLVAYGWEMGNEQGIISEKSSLDTLKVLVSRKIISKTAFIEYIEKAYKVRHKEAVELFDQHFPLKESTKKVYLSHEWDVRQGEKKRSRKNSVKVT